MWFLNALSATWNWLKSAFGSIGAALRNHPIASLLMVCAGLIAGVFAYRQAPEISDWVNRARPGQIIVNSPTVYTRQRLVNDRLNQTSWLREQLKLANIAMAKDFNMIDQVRAQIERTKSTASIGSGKRDEQAAPGSAPSAAPDAQRDDTGPPRELIPATGALFRAKNAFREEVRGEMTQTQLDDRHDIKGNTIYRLSFDATVIAGSRGNSVAAIKITLGHHPDKPRNDSLARMYRQDYEGLYRDWLRYTQDQVSKSLQSVSQSLLSSSPDATVRLLFSRFLIGRVCELLTGKLPDPQRIDATCDPDAPDPIASKTARINQDQVTKLLEWYRKERSIQWIGADDRQIESIIGPLINKGDIPPVDVAVVRQAAAAACRGRSSPTIALWELGFQTADAAQQMSRSGSQPPVVGCPYFESVSERFVTGVALYEMVMGYAIETPPEQRQRQMVNFEEAKNILELRMQEQQRHPDADAAARCFGADWINAKLNAFERDQVQPWERLGYFFRMEVIGRALNDCNILISAKPTFSRIAAELPFLLNRHTEVFSYSVTPRTLTENISTATYTRDLHELLLNYGLRMGERDAAVLAGRQNERSERLQAILGHPIVVGFASGNHDLQAIRDPNDPKREQTTAITRTSFGWLIAPRSRGGRSLEQIDGQFPLTAVISVPSWWRSIEAEVTTCWVARDELMTLRSAEQESVQICDGLAPTSDRTVIRLPGAIPELSRKLDFEVQQEPSLSDNSPQELEIGQPGTLLIKGGRLWRSTEVTLGAQRASEITVLPNMDGIIATFSCVLPPSGRTIPPPVADKANPVATPKVTPAEVRVWTSEGVTERLIVSLIWPPEKSQSSENPKTKSEATRWCGWDPGIFAPQ